jgi:hypothetical protein
VILDELTVPELDWATIDFDRYRKSFKVPNTFVIEKDR